MVEPVSRDQILRREQGQGNNNFHCSAAHKQDWQPYPVAPYSDERADRFYIYYVFPSLTRDRNDAYVRWYVRVCMYVCMYDHQILLL